MNTPLARLRRPDPNRTSTDPRAIEGRADRAATGPTTGAAPGPEIQALDALHSGLGNAFFADGTALDPTAVLLHQHTAGALALSVAGFEGAAALTPGHAPLSVMRQLMRRNSAEDEGLDARTAANNIGKRAGQPLPEAIRAKMERAFGHSFGHVRIHIDGGAADAADALHAMAFAIGSDIYFRRGAWRPGTPAGDELLAHELTHVVQADEGRLPSAGGPGLDVSSPTDSHEREAVTRGREVAKLVGSGGTDLDAVAPAADPMVGAILGEHAAGLQPAGAVAQGVAAPAAGEAQQAAVAPAAGASAALISRDAATAPAGQGSATESNRQGQGGGEVYATLTVGGQKVEVRVPQAEDRAAEAEVVIDERPIAGLHLNRAVVKIDENGVVVGGTVYGKLETGGFFNGTDVGIGILPGGQVAPSVKNVPVQIGNVQGTVDVELTEAGVSGEGTLHASDLGLPRWLGIEGGSLDFTFASGQVLGKGRLQGHETPHGQATADVTLRDTTVEIKVTYVVKPGLEPVPRVVIEQATLRGTITKDLGDLNQADQVNPWGGSTEGGAEATDTTAPSAAPTTQPDNEHIIGGGLSATDDIFAVASGYQQQTPSQVGRSRRAAAPPASTSGGTSSSASASSTSQSDVTSSTTGAATEAPAPRGPDAFLLTGTGRVVVADWIAGDMDLAYDPIGRSFDASGTLTAKTEHQLGELVTLGTTVSLDIKQNVPVEATAKLEFISEAYKLKGHIEGDYDMVNGKVEGNAVARVTHHIPFEGDYGQVRILRFSKVEGKYKDGDFKDLKGKLKVDAKLNAGGENQLQLQGVIDGEYLHKEGKVIGDLVAQTQADFNLNLGEGGGQGEGEAQAASQQLVLLKETTVHANLSEGQLLNVTMDAGIRYDRNGEPLLQGTTKGATWNVTDGKLTGVGTFTLMKSLERPLRGGEWKMRLLEGAEVSAEIQANTLTELGGSLTVQVDDAQGPLANGVIDDAKIDIATSETSGTLRLTTARKFHHPGEGRTLANGYGLVILENSGLNAVITKNELSDVGADLRTMITDSEGNLARLRLQGSMDLDTNEIDGKGTLSMARQYVVAENMANRGWEARLLRGTKAEGHIKDNAFTKISGQIKSGIYDEEGQFLTITGEGDYTIADEMFDIVGTITLSRETLLAETGDGAWSISLVEGKNSAQATIEDNVFQGISGTISTLVRRAGEDFARLSLEGTWNETDGFKGEGAAQLLVDTDVASIGEHHLWVTKGSGARIALENEGITKIGGTIPVRVDRGENSFLKGGVTGAYLVEEKELTGEGEVEVLTEEELGRLGNDQLWIIKGGGATVKIEKNVITKMGGKLNLGIRDDEGQYAKIAMEGTFDAQGGTGFTGSGAVTVTRNKQLYMQSGYSFWLREGVGAKAHIENNTLTKLDGQVPFMVRDGGPDNLLEGSVDGTYDPKTGQVTGTGDVRLGRTVEYDLGSGVVLKLLAGSGGNADVTGSRLDRLGGTLNAELWKDGEGIVRIEADGEYDVVHNLLTSLEGQATLLKPIEVAGGDIRIQNVVGTAAIQNNELISAGGRGEIVVVPLNNMMGTFEVEWANRGGVETYTGRGWLDFTLIDHDPETGRQMGGRVFAELKSGGDFQAAGEIDYSINHIIGGKLQVKVDNDLDPLVYGDMVVDTNLVEARNLFKLEQDIVPEIPIALPVPGLSLFMGMKGGMGADMNALRLNARIAVGNWRPLSEDAAVPSFETGLHMGWGMRFQAMVAPYIGLGGNIGFASAQMGVRGEVVLDTPVEVRTGGMLKGGPDGFYGELAVGAGISADVNLGLIPYIKGQVGNNMLSFEEDLDRFDQPLGEIFHFEWGGKYIFGDTQSKENAPIQRLDIPAPTQRMTAREGRPELGMGGGGGAASAKRGGPKIESGNEIAAQQKMGHGDMSGVMGTLQDAIAVIEGIGAAADLAGMIASALVASAAFGPAGLIVHIVWGIFTGSLSWDRIKTAVTKLVNAIQAAGRLLAKHMPGWWQSIQDVFSGEKPGLLDALFGADDRMREAVHRGDHRYAPPEMQAEMINTMKGGWCSEADQVCIVKVLEDAACRGQLRRVLRKVDGGANSILWGLDGAEDRQARNIFRTVGVRF